MKYILTFIAVMLALLVMRDYEKPAVVLAQSERPNVFVEPGFLTLRTPDGLTQVQGKMVVNLNNGEIWGFPTNQNSPYPIDPTTKDPPVSKPIYLGQFDFSTMKRTR